MRVHDARIAIVDSNPLFRARLISLLGRKTSTPIAEAADITKLEQFLAQGMRFDLVLLDAGPCRCAVNCPAAEARALLPQARVMVLAGELDNAQLRKSLAAGADAYLLKDIGGESLRASLELILLGEKVLPSALANDLSRECDDADALVPGSGAAPLAGAIDILSDRETEILRCLVDGDSNKRIANRLKIAEATVKVHLKSILRKTRAANRTQAAIWAFQRGVAGIAASDALSGGSGHARLTGRVAELAAELG